VLPASLHILSAVQQMNLLSPTSQTVLSQQAQWGHWVERQRRKQKKTEITERTNSRLIGGEDLLGGRETTIL
jgi:hypothetical protein